MFNLFKKLPEFVEDDTRKSRKLGYRISANFLNNRYPALLPLDILKNKTILDLGAAIGALGAWSLYYGAKHYTGVDSHFKNIATKNLSKYFEQYKWKWVEMDVKEFLEKCPLEYDVAVLSGIIYYFEDHSELLNLVKAKTIIIETDRVSETSYKPRKLEWEEKPTPRKFEPRNYYDNVLKKYTYNSSLDKEGRILLPEFYNDEYRAIYCYEK
tara:strand:- start:454 stop:1089 length:636 start_codon:yes stop_codon:yes gene_type:complete